MTLLETGSNQRLVAILAASVVGYSRLMVADEHAAVQALDRAREIFRRHIQADSGHVVDMAGDSVLAIFPSGAAAVRAAAGAQRAIDEANAAEAGRMRFRIGINLGEATEKADGIIYGDGVNVAARIKTLAPPGGISVSGKVREEIAGHLDVSFADQGLHQVKNIARPIRVWRIGDDSVPTSAAPRRMLFMLGVGVVGVILAAVTAIWLIGSRVLTEAPADPILALPAGFSIALPVAQEATAGTVCSVLADSHWRQRTPDSHLVARDCFAALTANEPNNAEAWAFSALLTVDEFLYGFNAQSGGGPALNRALTMAERAVGFDPASAWAHGSLARVAFFRKTFHRFDNEIEEALRLGPDDAALFAMVGALLCHRGDWTRGMAMLDEAVALDPEQQLRRHVPTFYDAYRRGDDEAALAAAEAMPDGIQAYLLRGAAYGQLGRRGEAAAAVADLRMLSPGTSIRSTTKMLQQWSYTYPLIARMGDGLRKAGLPED
ncbi:MAG TPA: adenylate/guanylate cyclase domain-containing protein [Alphaproteobacteria bacterium]|jgi:class 3 adenylate cyclase/tetratricopeptide (TPR) repeat protein|nr:adenylate/guanylate cyclase domain-containing protein [Alphaproteobacteria bacterium]